MRVEKRSCPGCKNDVLKAHRHCGRCGIEVPGFEPETLKCTKCDTDVLKSFAFCPSCATPTASEDETFKSSLDLLGAFAEGRKDFAEGHAALPAVDADEVDLKSVNELLRANTRGDGDDKYLEMGPIVVEVIKSLAGLSQQGAAHAGATHEHLVHVGDGIGKLCSAVLAIGTRVDARITELEESIKSLAGTSRGRRAIVTALERPGGKDGGDDKEDVDAAQCRLAMNVAIKSMPDLLNEIDVSRITEITNMGGGLKAIANYNAPLGAKMKKALEGVAAA